MGSRSTDIPQLQILDAEPREKSHIRVVEHPTVERLGCLLGHVTKLIEILQAKTIDASMIFFVLVNNSKPWGDGMEYRGAGLGNRDDR